jgi:hypothetical protein
LRMRSRTGNRDGRLRGRYHGLRFFRIQRGAALSAEIIGGTELDECAFIASNHFP